MLTLDSLHYFTKHIAHEIQCTMFSSNSQGNFKDLHVIDELNYDKFFKDYLLSNIPCIIRYPFIREWRSCKEWVTKEGKPNLSYLDHYFGDSIVPVADCNIKEYNSQMKCNMKLKEYILYWKNLKETDNENQQCLYLKDWHFNRTYPDYKAYETPEYFTSDWLNEFCTTQSDDYQFVYMGPKGTWTPLHADIFESYSWSANICGRKRWILFPPGIEKYLVDKHNKPLYSVSDFNLNQEHVEFFEVIQEAGEIIFVPSGWYHQVWNLEDTISINHNWFNGCNILHIWYSLKNAAFEVEKEISDCKGFDGWIHQWQTILKVYNGMNYEDFLKMLDYIFESRSNYISNSLNHKQKWHFVFDILCIKNILSIILMSDLPLSICEVVKTIDVKVLSFMDSQNGIFYLFKKLDSS